MNHGKLIHEGPYRGCRECTVHGQHGPLYVCPNYDRQIREEIRKQTIALNLKFNDPEFRKNVDPAILEIFDVFRSTKKEYRGWITTREDADDHTFITIDDANPLAKTIEEHIHSYGSYLSVRYVISDEEIKGDINEAVLKIIFGVGDADYHARYSEETGYLWTDEKLNVGGHDLLNQLIGSIGKYLVMEIVYS